MTDPGPPEPEPEPGPAPDPLPGPVLSRVLTLAADALGALPEAEVPVSLRPLRRFTPARRARLAGAAVGAALAAEPGFRAAVAQRVRAQVPELAGVLDTGAVPATVPLVEAAALAHLLGTPGHEELAARAAEHLADQARRSDQARRVQQADRARAELAEVRARSRAELAAAAAAAAAAREEAAGLRRRLREAQAQLARLSREAAASMASLQGERDAAAAAAAAAQAESARLRSELAAARAVAESARRGDREARRTGEARLRLLLDTVISAARGLSEELALPPTDTRPGDAIAAELPGEEAGQPRVLDAEDAAVAEQLLRLPGVHLLVDGYNVTKTGYGQLPLDQQRSRLVAALAALAARTGAEVTCVFDAASRPAGTASATPAPRGVRVVFTPAGVIADEILVRFAAAEPPGRPVLVATSDAAVARAVRRTGARVLASPALLAVLGPAG